jgi:hypothetical protein
MTLTTYFEFLGKLISAKVIISYFVILFIQLKINGLYWKLQKIQKNQRFTFTFIL